jgi:cephalosporin-C deacetylase
MAQFDLPPAELEQYRPERHEPADFDAFWHRTLASAAAFELAPAFEPVDALLPGVRIFDVRWSGFAGQRVAGWFLTPPDAAGPLPCVVQFIGYGGGRGRPHEWLLWPAAGYCVLVVDSRGQGDGDTVDLPGVGPQHTGLLTRGILDPDDYYYRRLFTDAVRAVDVAAGRAEVDADRIVVAGASQGGGIAQAVAGLHPGVAAAIIDVPFLTHFRRAATVTDSHPYREIGLWCGQNRDLTDRAFATLDYFDGLNFAVRASAPALYAVALMDDVCPPSTVFAAFHHYGGPKELRVWPFNGHEGGATHQPPINLAWLRRVAAE